MSFLRDNRTLLIASICIISGLFLFCSGINKHPVSLALLSGTFTSFLTVLLVDLYDKLKFFSYLNPLTSKEWVGWNINERQIVKHKILKKGNGEIEFNSYATIKYKVNNVLSVCLKHKTGERDIDEKKWQGTIEINKDFMNRGVLTFKYTDSHEVVCKEVIIQKDTQSIYIYLIPVNNKIYEIGGAEVSKTPKYDYGTEVLIKKR